MRIGLQNFKPIGNYVELDLKPITILVGPNGAGKSSILEAICLAAQSARHSNGYIKLDGDLVKYPSYEAIFPGGDTSKPLSIKFAAKVQPEDFMELMERFGIKVEEVFYTYTIYVKTGQMFVEEGVSVNDKVLVHISRDFDGGWKNRAMGDIPHKYDNRDARVSGSFKILDPDSMKQNYFTDVENKIINVTIGKITNYFTRQLSGVKLLQSSRGNIQFHSSSANDSLWVGINGEYLLQIMSKIFSDPKFRDIKAQIIKWAEKFGIADLSAGWFGSDRLQSGFVDPVSHKDLNLALAGLGSKQALTMLVQLFWSQKGDMILIEEPEINLHPEGQVSLPFLFADIVNNGKSLIMTTHSEFLILALSKPIRDGLLKRENIRIYNLEKTEEGTKVKCLEIAENGYIENWIPSFTRVEKDLLEDFLKSVPESEPETKKP